MKNKSEMRLKECQYCKKHKTMHRFEIFCSTTCRARKHLLGTSLFEDPTFMQDQVVLHFPKAVEPKPDGIDKGIHTHYL